MSVNLARLRTTLQAFDWKPMFVEVLKWSRTTERPWSATVDGQGYMLTPVAQMADMHVYVCTSDSGVLPIQAIRRQIENQVKERRFEHIIIFEDDQRQEAVFQWIKRGQGAAHSREFTYRRGQSGDMLIQRLSGIAFDFSDLDEQGRIDIVNVTARVAKQFDVEGITRKFYDDFTRQRDTFQKFLQGIPIEDDQRWYVSVMLNRLMFIYFIQAKRFLNNDPEYLQTKLAWSQANLGPDRFYRGFLCVLFFEGFAHEQSERSDTTQHLLGDIPYLNGGLFLPHVIEDTYGDSIRIPDAAFEKLFTFFSSWRWHLNERPGGDDRAIDPDVLGYIFEKYINKKLMGAYYTKEDITGYICRSTIIPALFDKANLSLSLLDLPKHGEAYVYPALKQADRLPTETDREYAARQDRVQQLVADARAGKIITINDAITANLNLEAMIFDLVPFLDAQSLHRLYQALITLSILDPTCGSGAFLFAAIKILKPIYEQVLDRMALLVERRKTEGMPLRAILDAEQAHPNRDYFITKSIVVRNLYGVDIMEEATEICKLRLFLRLVADLEDAAHVEPLPDIDFNIRAGNTLVGYASIDEIGGGYKGGIAGLPKRVQQTIQDVEAVQRELSIYRNSQLQLNPSSDVFGRTREGIRTKIASLNTALDADMLKMGQISGGPDGRFNTQPFHWFTAFYEIISNGGFDVIVGNPPYLEIREVDYKPQAFTSRQSGAIHAMCIERSLQMLHKRGSISMIVPLALVSTQRMQIVQQLIERNRSTWYTNYSWRPGKLFDTVNRALTIFIAISSDHVTTHSTAYQKWYTEGREHLMYAQSYIQVSSNRNEFWVPKLGQPIERRLLEKVRAVSTKFGSFTAASSHRIYYRTTGGLYWKVFTDFPPAFKVKGAKGSSSRETWLSLADKAAVRPGIAVLSSNLFWWWYTITSNLRDLNPYDVQNFPVPASVLKSTQIARLGEKYLDDLQANSQMLVRIQKSTGETETQSFKIQKSKPIIDEIDRELAQHYGFTKSELDFIINYDIKYRMGRDSQISEED